MDFIEFILLFFALLLTIATMLPPGFIHASLRRFLPFPNKPPKKPRNPQPRPLRPKSEDACPFCRQHTRASAAASPKIIPWSQVKSRRGRKKTCTTHGFACPNRTCPYYGITDARVHALIGSGWQGKGKAIHELHCQACNHSFSERTHTPYARLKTPLRTVSLALTCLASGVPRATVSEIFGPTDETLLRWLSRSGEHAERLHALFFHHILCHHLQLDELYLRLRSSLDGKWLWVAMDAVSKIVPVVVLGSRKAEMAYQLVHQLKPLLAPTPLPVFSTDGLKHYFYALTAHFGGWVDTESRRTWLVSPELLYGQLKKVQRRSRLLRVERNMLLGGLSDLRSRLKASGLSGRIQTSFVERINLTLRQGISFLARKTWGLAWSQDSLMAHVHWFRAYYHFARPHLSLRQRLAQPQRTTRGRLRRWRQRTPAMTAGLTDHIWSVHEILSYPVFPG